ncbi:MAG: hypothetical protein COU85_01055 [Candidatus Portnoybacteria bacterium CG10_big_fil_rev_8_21_14_0_10_44_7]|uniref:Uncharacterized protein n=1 Tax=Candidatus Portnoybacteria bacterium CG10_big_fil_rev_8_21_14_0_10_44_7 TaxID=1974816 RepID=A0A2M8KJ58_9BACT|nr:MAG: hypothetical protein COU85_01055 [Candidatus Portnoybacteria bacterium CG10_big_fil_rev_8_21_14_0_10_44_7]
MTEKFENKTQLSEQEQKARILRWFFSQTLENIQSQATDLDDFREKRRPADALFTQVLAALESGDNNLLSEKTTVMQKAGYLPKNLDLSQIGLKRALTEIKAAEQLAKERQQRADWIMAFCAGKSQAAKEALQKILVSQNSPETNMPALKKVVDLAAFRQQKNRN